MQAATYQEPGNVRIEERTAPEIEEPTDAIVRITHTAICGSDLWFYRSEEDHEESAPVGHEPEELMDDVLQGILDPSPVFPKTIGLDGIPEGYQAMDEWEVVKLMVDLDEGSAQE